MKNTFAQLVDCPDGTLADASVGCTTSPNSIVNSEIRLAEVIAKFGNGFMNLVIAVSIIFLIIGSIKYTLAAGEDEKIQKAKRTIIWSVGGLVLAISARLVAQLVLSQL